MLRKPHCAINISYLNIVILVSKIVVQVMKRDSYNLTSKSNGSEVLNKAFLYACVCGGEGSSLWFVAPPSDAGNSHSHRWFAWKCLEQGKFLKNDSTMWKQRWHSPLIRNIPLQVSSNQPQSQVTRLLTNHSFKVHTTFRETTCP